jgi:tRNA modification GTPase
LHTIGSLPLLTSLVEAAIRCGARAARPGEFTMRAFLSGRLDLTQAEAVLGVIEAEGRGSLNHALRQLAGNLSRPLEHLRSEVLDLLADVEAGLDFVDEDIEFVSDEVLAGRLAEIDAYLASTWQLMGHRGGGAARPVIALRGEPNAGKSCLLNRLAETPAAIVADLPGTTRDVVTAEAIVGGRPVMLVDTAGIEVGGNEIDRRSQEQAERASQEASVRLWCLDQSRIDFRAAAAALRETAHREQSPRVRDLWVATKSDLTASESKKESDVISLKKESDVISWDWIACSAVTGHGIEELRRRIDAVLADRDAEESGSVVGTAARCRDSLQKARSAISAAIRMTQQAEGHEFVATELRTVAESLGEVTGAVYTDDILDRVFSRFCIGK